MQGYYTPLFISLEIGKNVHWLAAYAGFELLPIVEPLEVRSDQSGFEQVTKVIDGLLSCGQYERVVLGHEPTGIYHEAWARALSERYSPYQQGQLKPQLEYRFVNPLVSKRKRETSGVGRKRKTDKIDLKAIALCLRDGQGQPAFLPTAQDLRFQLWGRAYRQVDHQQRQLTVLLLSELDRLWPGAVVNLKRFQKLHPHLETPTPLVLSKPLERQRLRAILSH